VTLGPLINKIAAQWRFDGPTWLVHASRLVGYHDETFYPYAGIQ